MTYVYQPNEGDGTLYVRQLDGAKSYTIPDRIGAGLLRQFALRRLFRQSAERVGRDAVAGAAVVDVARPHRVRPRRRFNDVSRSSI